MRIGLVYDLRDDYQSMGLDEEHLAEFDRPETLAALEAALQEQGYQTERIGSFQSLAAALVEGRRWDLVFNIAEGWAGRSREARVPALLEGYYIPYVFSDPLTLAVALDKAICKRLVRDAGIPTAPFVVLHTEEDLLHAHLPFPLFLKPVAEGSGKGCSMQSRVEDRAGLAMMFRYLRHRFAQPVLVEPFLPGREFTVGIVGNGADIRLHGVTEILFNEAADAGVYTYANKEASTGRVRYQWVEDAEARMAMEYGLVIYRLLGCRDAGRLDFRSDSKGIPHFLEINPLAGLHPTLSGLPIMASRVGWSYNQLIQTMVEVALLRLNRRME
ncbi:MAG: hypothetical protein H7839_19170 [Magnetococcus sp. YQC-5]